MMTFVTIAAAIALSAATTPAFAGTELQLQFQRWVYEGNGLVRLMVSLRNPTMKPFARVVWTCDFFDKEKRLVGQSPLVFHVVPWGTLILKSHTVVSDMFQDGECQLAEAEEVTYRNERLYRVSVYEQRFIGLGLDEAQQWFDFKHRIQGRTKVITKEEDDRLQEMHKAGELIGPGYRAANAKQ
jgi:hypothetical protein